MNKGKKLFLIPVILSAVILISGGCGNSIKTRITDISSVTMTSVSDVTGESTSTTDETTVETTTATATETTVETESVTHTVSETACTYILNTNTHKFHKPDCASVRQMSESNKQEVTDTREAISDMGYVACQRCNP